MSALTNQPIQLKVGQFLERNGKEIASMSILGPRQVVLSMNDGTQVTVPEECINFPNIPLKTFSKCLVECYVWTVKSGGNHAIYATWKLLGGGCCLSTSKSKAPPIDELCDCIDKWYPTLSGDQVVKRKQEAHIFQLLRSHPETINMQDAKGRYPLALAFQKKAQLVIHLIDSGARLDIFPGSNALIETAKGVYDHPQEAIEIARRLIAKGISVNAQETATGKSALHYLCEKAIGIEFIRFLGQHGANLCTVDMNGDTPFATLCNTLLKTAQPHPELFQAKCALMIQMGLDVASILPSQYAVAGPDAQFFINQKRAELNLPSLNEYANSYSHVLAQRQKEGEEKYTPEAIARRTLIDMGLPLPSDSSASSTGTSRPGVAEAAAKGFAVGAAKQLGTGFARQIIGI